MELQQFMDDITEGKEVRQTLSRLRQELRANPEKKADCIGNERMNTFLRLLSHEDPKTRKNAALLLGDLGELIEDLKEQEKIVESLWDSYVTEQTQFVRSSYVKALGTYDCQSLVPQMHQELDEIRQREVEEEEKKHKNQLMEELYGQIRRYEKQIEYVYRGIKKKHVVLLTIDPYMRENLLAQVQEKGYKEAKIVPRGVRLVTDTLEYLYEIDTYRELWFGIRFRDPLAAQGEKLPEGLAESELLPLLREVYGEKERYPIGVRFLSQHEAKKTKDLLHRIEECSKGCLYNDPKRAAAELLLLERGDGAYVVYARISGSEKERFAYREHILPTSMSPVVAAQMVELIRPYLAEGAHVIDPFCGVGTLLMERCRAVRPRDVYGVDSYGEAIIYGREAAEKEKQTVYFINRDYFDFTSSYLMDEVITEVPRMEHRERGEVDSFYRSFFDKTEEITGSDAMIFVLSTEEQALKKQLRLHGAFQLVRQIPMRGREQIYILKRRGDYNE